ncbi:MAG: hypothetical protein PHW50_02100 [Patescibacteria group bacterium]|nr:hypothetical protein [Patescibacteria group bacterium]
MKQKQIPELYIKENLEKETKQFYKFLHHQKFPQHRYMILESLPGLKKNLKSKIKLSKKDELKIIKQFISEFRKNHQIKINLIIKKSQQLNKTKFKKSIKILAELMDYQWPNKKIVYTAIPTILPFSPFENPTFYFSILGQIYGKSAKQRDIIFVAIHEISHFLLFDILEKIYQKPLEKIISSTSLYFLKEAITPALMNQSKMNKILKLKKYRGNPNVKYIRIKFSNKIMTLTELLSQIYIQRKNKEKKDFEEIIKEMIQIIKSIEPEINKRDELWNKFGGSLIKNKKLFRKYANPIKIK